MQIKEAVMSGSYDDKIHLMKTLNRVNAFIKNGYKSHLDKELFDLKSIFETALPKEGIEYKMVLRDKENINFGTNPALLNDLPKLVDVS